MRVMERACTLFILAASLDLASRQLARVSLIARSTRIDLDASTVLFAAVIGAIIGLAASRIRARHETRLWRPVSLLLTLAFTAGLFAQLQLGARLQSDGFYYFSYLRSVWFDRDVDLTNDYRLLGLDDVQHQFLFTPTVTGHAQSAWAIGPALAWSPFFAGGSLTATLLARAGRDVARDGTSFPYRQAVCIAGLFYGLLGAWCCWRLTSLFFPAAVAGAATAVTIGGSFMLWYVVKEPTMSHAPSMASVAAFVWTWAATRSRRDLLRWTVLGLLAGGMMTIRWQNALFLLFPAVELAAAYRGRPPVRREGSAYILGTVAVLLGAAGIGFMPQMLAWLSIYGHPFAVSPVGPRLFWTHPHLIDVLWSSRNGLFALSPILYVAAIGLLLFVRIDRRLGLTALVIAALMVWVNASVEDWWGGAGFGGRRFDSLIPLFVLGTATAWSRARALVERRPTVATATLFAALVLWNLTFMDLALTGAFRIGQPVAFESIAGGQAETLHRWAGHPFSWPLNLLYALRYGVAPWRFDVLQPNRFLGDETRPYGRIDVGGDDESAIAGGWYGRETADGASFRWATREAELFVALDRVAPLRVQVQVQPFTFVGAPPQQMTVTVNGRRLASVDLALGWQRLELLTDEGVWRRGLNRVVFAFSRADRPVDVGAGGDVRQLSAAIDYVRVEIR